MSGDEPKRVIQFTPEELKTLMKEAAQETLDEASDRFVRQVGIGVLRKLAYIVGLALLAIGIWLAKGGFPK